MERPHDHLTESDTAGTTVTDESPGRRLARNMIFYTVLRLLLFVAVVAAIIGIGQLVGTQVPVLVAGIVALLVAFPLSMVLFTRLRRAINEDIAAVDAGRRERREDLRRRLSES